MNDFTKEELEDIFEGLDDCWRMQPENEIILNKLQSMIDNYCKHTTCSEAEVFVDVCHNCDAMILQNKTLAEYNE